MLLWLINSYWHGFDEVSASIDDPNGIEKLLSSIMLEPAFKLTIMLFPI